MDSYEEDFEEVIPLEDFESLEDAEINDLLNAIEEGENHE